MEQKEADIISRLYVKEEDLHKQTEKIVSALFPHVGIEPESKKIIIKNDELTNRQKICCYLIAKYFMKRQGLVEDPSANLGELGEHLGILKTTLTAPLKTLVDKKFVDRSEGKYQINFYKINDFVSELGG